MARQRKEPRHDQRDRQQAPAIAPTAPVSQNAAAGPLPNNRIAATPGRDRADDLQALRAQIDDTRRELNDRLDALAAAVDRLLPAARPATSATPLRAGRPRPNLRVGDDVYVPRFGGMYSVVEAPARGQTLKVQAGPMRVELRYDEVWTLDEAPPEQAPEPGHAPSPNRPNPDPAIPSIDLHGYSEANALITLDLFLHHEYARRTHRVRIIHGKGNGILRDAVRRELARNTLVRAIDTGAPFQGDDGVTLADLDL